MSDSIFDQRVADFRSFTRFFTAKTGVLREQLLGSKYGLTEARVIYELAVRDQWSAKELTSDLGLDAAYISRVLKKFENLDLITRERSQNDRRQQLISLTKKGRAEYALLNCMSAKMFGDILHKLSDDEQRQLHQAMDTIACLLDEEKPDPAPFILRPHRPGDMGWIVHAHGRLYTEEFGWGEKFEALVAEITASFLKNFDAESDCCWVAEKDGQNIGSAMVVRADRATAKLRVVIVDPSARGLGVGEHLVAECIRFARRKGYSKMTLWTDSSLRAAVALYKKLGFKLVDEERERDFGRDLVSQTWELDMK